MTNVSMIHGEGDLLIEKEVLVHDENIFVLSISWSRGMTAQFEYVRLISFYGKW